MKVKITYNVSGEELETLLENEGIEKVEIVSGGNSLVEAWLETHNIDGHAIVYAHKRFCDDNPTAADLSVIKFSKAVKATGLYTVKNLRIADSVQRCFVAL